MEAKFLKAIATGALLAISGVVAADEPVALNEAQMDGVTAGGAALAETAASAFGLISAATFTATLTDVRIVTIVPTEAGQLAYVQSTSQAAAAASSF
ncbi:hypothetical protein [Methylomagnum sp.]